MRRDLFWSVVLALVGLVALDGGCSADAGLGACTCADGSFCQSRADCTRPCSASAPCDPGHACLPPDGGVSLCSELCDANFCGGASICDSPTGHCVVRQCNATVPCADAAKACDVSRGLCLALSGTCESFADCLTLPDDLSSFDVVCGAPHVCEVKQSLSSFPSVVSSNLMFVTPTPGEGYPDEGAIELVWNQMDRPTFVEVFSKEVTTVADYDSALLWVASWRPGQPAPHWADGFHVENGQWAKPPNHLPAGVPLYAVALALDGPSLSGATPLTPFFVSPSPWPAPGSACQEPRNCLNPAQSQTCVGGFCRVLCLSDVGCPRGHLCDAPLQGVRTCAR